MTQALIPTPNARARSMDTSPLTVRTRKYFDSHIAEGTKQTYHDALTQFHDYCTWKGHPTLPSTLAAIVDYITFLAEGGKSVAWIQVTLAAISYDHRMHKFDDPTNETGVKVIMRGIRRQRKTRANQKEPITRDVLASMLERLEETASLVHLRDRALLLVGYAGAFRQSELCGLLVSDVQLRVDEMIITLRKSKTDQEGRGIVKRLPRLEATPSMCPVRAVERWIAAAKISGGPLFRKVDRHGHVSAKSMNPRSVAFIVKRSLPVNADSAQFAGHSLRAGFVTQAAQDGTPEYEIQEVTKHKSADMLRRYIRDNGIGQHGAIRRALTGEE